MRIDLFEFVEGLIRGVVYFLYNLIETIWQILRHPIRGPTRLYRAYVRKGEQQIGGLTLIFLFFFGAFGLTGMANFGLGGENRTSNVSDIIAKPPRLDSDAAWTPIVGALVAIIVIDAALRGFFRWRLRGRREHQRMAVATVEYALIWPLLGLLTYEVFGERFWDMYSILPNVVVDGLGQVASFAIFIPPVRQFLARARRRRPGVRRSWRSFARTALAWIGAIAGLFILVVAAISFGDTAMRDVQKAGREGRRLVPESLSCSLAGEHPFADIALRNPTNQPIILAPYKELEAVLIAEHYEFAIYSPEPPDPNPMPVLFEPNATQVVRLALPKAIAVPANAKRKCFVREADYPTLNVEWDPTDWDSYDGDGVMEAWTRQRLKLCRRLQDGVVLTSSC